MLSEKQMSISKYLDFLDILDFSEIWLNAFAVTKQILLWNNLLFILNVQNVTMHSYIFFYS